MDQKKLNKILALIPGDFIVANLPDEIENQLQDDDKHRLIIYGEYENQQAVMRVYKKENSWTVARFSNENSILQLADDAGLTVPSVLYKDETNLTVIHSFLDGKSGGDSLFFNEGFIDKTLPDSLVVYIKKIQSIVATIKSLPMPLIDRYKHRIDIIRENWPDDCKQELEKINNFFLNNYSEIFSHVVLTHGDANPGNFIYHKKQFGLIDWENVCYDSPWFDFATIYRSSLLYPKWAAEFLDEIKLTSENKSYFYFFLALILATETSGLILALQRKDLRYYRSQTMTKEQLTSLIKNNTDKIKECCDFLS